MTRRDANDETQEYLQEEEQVEYSNDTDDDAYDSNTNNKVNNNNLASFLTLPLLIITFIIVIASFAFSLNTFFEVQQLNDRVAYVEEIYKFV